MVFQRSSLRYAHTTGHTGLVYTNNGEFIITCGSDGDIRKWTGIDDDDPTSSCLGEFVICLAYDDRRLLASTDRNTVQAYTFPDMDNDGTLLRFTAQVTCMRVTDLFIAAGSEDSHIKVLTKGETQKEMYLQGHTGPVLALDISAQSMLASIGGDGQLKIWNLADDGKEIKSIAGLPRANSFETATLFGTPTFEPRTGDSLAYVNGKDIFVLNTNTWEVKFKLSDERAKGIYTCCQFSNDGQFLAAGTDAGEISVFDFMRKQSIKCEAPCSECQAIIGLCWNPKNNKELAFCDDNGQLGTLFGSSGGVGSGMIDDEASEIGEMDFDGIEFQDDDIGLDNQITNDDHNDDDGVSIEKLKSRVMSGAGIKLGDEDSRDSIGKSSFTSEAPAVTSASIAVKTFKQQEPFQPTSTPTHFEHRYLVWNNVGIVTSHSDSTDGSIDVEFHDASVHHALHISNYNHHNIASLSSTVLALSAQDATKLVCIALAASGNKEWSVNFPDCESTEAIAATNKIVAVVTSMNFLRLYTVMGTQREVITIPGRVVAMAGFENRLIICYHSAPANEKQQHIAAMLIQLCGLSLRCQEIPFPLPSERKLTWLGFSDCGSPAFSDSMGLVQLFSLKSNCWYPVCDTMKHSQSVSNSYFIISILERSQLVQAVLCRASVYPMTNPRPMMQELPMQLPLCDAEVEKSELEDRLIRGAFMSMENADKTIKETAIKLFALSCRSEFEMRAKELIETIACPDLLQLAVKYATKLGRIHLSDRLCELMPQLEEQTLRGKQELNEFLANQRLPDTHIIQINNSPSTSHLAPKAMALSYGKKAVLKRFSAANSALSISSIKRSHNESQANNSEPFGDSQENVYSNSVTKETQLENTGESLRSADESKELGRSPLNSVNPFATKRKISDVDATGKKGGFMLGSEKLKLIKK